MAELDEILSAIGEVGKKVDGLETRVTALEEVATEPKEVKEDIKEDVKEDIKEEVMLEDATCGDKKEEEIKKSSDDIAKLQQRILMLEQKGAKLMQV